MLNVSFQGTKTADNVSDRLSTNNSECTGSVAKKFNTIKNETAGSIGKKGDIPNSSPNIDKSLEHDTVSFRANSHKEHDSDTSTIFKRFGVATGAMLAIASLGYANKTICKS